MSDDAAVWCFGFVFEAALELSSRLNPAPAMSALLEEGRRVHLGAGERPDFWEYRTIL